MSKVKATLGKSSKLDQFIGGKNRQRDPIKDEMLNSNAAEIERLTIKELFKLNKPLKFAPNIWKDGKKLEKLLGEMCKVVNTLVTCSQ